MSNVSEPVPTTAPSAEAQAGSAASAGSQAGGTFESSRLTARLRTFEEAARKRLEGTAAEKLAQRAGTAVSGVADRVDAMRGKVARELPDRFDQGLDRWLDRVGLIRKSRVGSARPETHDGTTQDKTQAA